MLGQGPRALDELVGEVIALYHQASAIAEQMHREGERSAGRRAVLRELAVLGPKTVPQMARERPVSRQYIQALVNGLRADGYVELLRNPRHKRSRLVRVTPAGRRRVREMERREARLFRGLRLPTPASELRAAAATLRTVRAFLEEWSRGLEGQVPN